MKNNSVNLSKYENNITLRHQFIRILWNLIWTLFARPFPRSFGNKWRIFLLRLFGAKIHHTASVYSSVRIYLPANLEMGSYSCLAPDVDCYNVDRITIGSHTTVSQKTYLCSASHEIMSIKMPLIHAPIVIDDQVWVGADAYISMGVKIGEGAVVGARSSVYKDVPEWTVVGGNPAKFIKFRKV